MLLGRNFGDEGLFFLAESLAYNQVRVYLNCILFNYKSPWKISAIYSLLVILYHLQTAEEVSFAANGITAKGIMAFDGILQSNVALKSLNLSGNSIGDEGVKVDLHR